MKLSSLLQGIEVLNLYEDVEIERVTDKFEDIEKNTLFVCINGNRTDGHLRAENAFSRGAVAVLCEKNLNIDNQILTTDTRSAYSKIAGNFYKNPACKLKLIGITGTNGKTSTAFYVKSLLDALGKKCGLIGTVENFTGSDTTTATLTTPEPMELNSLLAAMVENGCEYCVMEVSSQALAQKRVESLRFSLSVITNITPEHLDYHGTMDEYIKAKEKLFSLSDMGILNIDDENVKSIAQNISCKITTCSAQLDSADYTAKNIVLKEDGVQYEFVGMDCIDRIKLKSIGKFSVYNSLLAVTVLLKLGFSVNEIAKAFQNVTAVKGRAEIVPTNKNFTVIIDYAHTPDGLENIINSVREITKGKLIVLFGCGGDRDKQKRGEMGRIAGQLSDLAIVTSDNPRTENPLLIINDILCGMEKARAHLAVIENRRDAISFALKKARKGDTVLLCGKGHETYQIIGTEKIHFDEREIINELITL